MTLVAALGGLYFAYKKGKRESNRPMVSAAKLQQSEQSEAAAHQTTRSAMRSGPQVHQQREEKDSEAYKLVRKNEDKIKSPQLYGGPSRCSIENL